MTTEIHCLVIGIPTFKRPKGLRRLLDTLAVQQSDYTVKVLVADNEGEKGDGHRTVKQLVGNYPLELFVIPVIERGISHVRNAIMEFAFDDLQADMLAMLDDDETVDSNWLQELVAMQQAEQVDVVGGTVLPEFAIDPPCWTEGLNLYWRTIHPPGRIDLIQGTGNVLLNRSVWNNYAGMRFDPEFGLTGGGDKEFFTRLKNAGASFAFAPTAISHELIESSRLSKKWVKERAYRIGSGDIRIMKTANLKTGRATLEFVKAISAIIYYSLVWSVSLYSDTKRVHARLKIARQQGKLNGLFGKPPQVYRQVHGS